MKRKTVLIVDPPERRSIPAVYRNADWYEFSFIIPVRARGVLVNMFKALFRICKPAKAKRTYFLHFQDEEDFIDALVAFLKKNKFDQLLAFSERSTALLLANKARLEELTEIPYGTFRDFNLINDKFEVSKIASETGIPVPKFLEIDGMKDIDRWDGEYPVVLKCRLASGVRESLRICQSEEELKAAWQDLKSGESQYRFFPRDKMVIQEFIKGKIYDGNFSVSNGNVTAAMTQKRVWTIPVEGGFGAFNRTESIPEIYQYGTRFFNAVKWTGPAQMEFIRDETDGQYKLIEINPRFWGTLALSLKAGVNFPKYVLEGRSDRNGGLPQQPENNIPFKWYFHETMIAEALMKKGKFSIFFRHLNKVLFSREKHNFSYGFMPNLLLTPSFILTFLKIRKGKLPKAQSQSFITRIFG